MSKGIPALINVNATNAAIINSGKANDLTTSGLSKLADLTLIGLDGVIGDNIATTFIQRS